LRMFVDAGGESRTQPSRLGLIGEMRAESRQEFADSLNLRTRYSDLPSNGGRAVARHIHVLLVDDAHLVRDEMPLLEPCDEKRPLVISQPVAEVETEMACQCLSRNPEALERYVRRRRDALLLPQEPGHFPSEAVES
jgi:hypothetical protein